MVNLKEKFGRRMALIGLAIAASLIAIVVLSANVISANAAEDASKSVWDRDHVFLSSNIVAPVSESFDSSTTYKFTYNDSSFVTTCPDTLTKYDGLTTTYAYKYDGSAATATAKTKPNGGTETTIASDKITKVIAKGNGYSAFKEGGIPMTDAEWGDGNGTNRYPAGDETTLYGHIMQVPIDSIFGWDLSSSDKIKAMFPETGDYIWDVKTDSQTFTDLTKDTDFVTSKAEYKFVVTVASKGDDWIIDGCIIWQTYTDWYYKVEVKKCPYWSCGRSFHPYYVPWKDEGAHNENALVFEGFTFTHFLWSDVTKDASFEPVTIQKEICGNYHPYEEYEFNNINFYSNTWNYDGSILQDPAADPQPTPADTSLKGVILDSEGHVKQFVEYTAAKATVGSDGKVYYLPTYVQTQESFKVSNADNTAMQPATSIKLGHKEKLVFDGNKTDYECDSRIEASGKWITDKLPVGTYYTATEVAAGPVNAVDVEPHVFVGTANAAHSTKFIDSSSDKVMADTSLTGVDMIHGTKNAGVAFKYTYCPFTQSAPALGTAANAIVSKVPVGTTPSEANSNKVYFVNYAQRDITGFMINSVPYIVMIGIPILAFVAWIVSRKRRANK